MKSPGLPASAASGRSPHVQLARAASASISQTPLHLLHGTITPSDLHYEVHRAGVPEIDPATYRLLIHGLVDRPTIFTLDDLKALPSITRICFLECGGNYPRNAKGPMTPQAMAGLTSQTEWTGVPLAVLFREVGIRQDATWCLAEGQDAVAMTRSVPVAKVIDEGMVAYVQNGEPLRPSQGFPARLVLPGLEGVANVKWVRRLELGSGPSMTREETARYTEEIRDQGIRIHSFELDARSIVTAPAPPSRVQAGWIEIRGLAWSGRGRIARVDVSTDNERSWTAATLLGPVLPKAHVRFVHPWRWHGQPTTISSRAVDETGYVQPTVPQLIAARGVHSPGYHINPIVGWQLHADGGITVREEPWR
jgi:sulfane dehydrogenase subunit SoxC